MSVANVTNSKNTTKRRVRCSEKTPTLKIYSTSKTYYNERQVDYQVYEPVRVQPNVRQAFVYESKQHERTGRKLSNRELSNKLNDKLMPREMQSMAKRFVWCAVISLLPYISSYYENEKQILIENYISNE